MVGLIGHGARDAAFAAALAVGSFAAFGSHGLFLVIVLARSVVCLLPVVTEGTPGWISWGWTPQDNWGTPLGRSIMERGESYCWPKECCGQAVPRTGKPLQQYLSLEGQREPLQVWVGRADVKSPDSTCHQRGLEMLTDITNHHHTPNRPEAFVTLWSPLLATGDLILLLYRAICSWYTDLHAWGISPQPSCGGAHDLGTWLLRTNWGRFIASVTHSSS